jgi:uncharacterized Zn-finger protein
MVELKQNTQRLIEISAKDLPLRCPMPDMSKWNSHPRVFLALDDNGEAICPYCSTRYKLVGGSANSHH